MRGAGTRGGLGLFGVAVAICALSMSAVPVDAQQDGAEGFSAAERRQLAAGELVVRPRTQRRGQLRLIGGNSWQVVNRSAETVWRVLTDEASYSRILPSTESARVVSHRPGVRVVRFSHSVGPVRATYHLRMEYDHGRRDIAFRLDPQRENDLRAGWGFLGVTPYEDDPDRSLVSWGVMADVGGGMLGGVLRGQIHEWTLRVPSTVRQHIHARH